MTKIVVKDHCVMRINKANLLLVNDIIIIKIELLKHNKITLLNELEIRSNIKIINESENDLTITTNGSCRLFHVFPLFGEQIINYLELVSEKCKMILSNGATEDNGGAFYIEPTNHNLILKNIIIKDNLSKMTGGAIFTNSNVTLISVDIECNQAYIQGGAIYSGINCVIKKSKIKKNKVTTPNFSSGGIIYVDNGDCIINESQVVYNNIAYDLKAKTGGSGTVIVMNGSIHIHDSHIDHNTAFSSSAIQQGIGNVYIEKSTVSHNKSTTTNDASGGTVSISLGTIYVADSDFCCNETHGMFASCIVCLVGEMVIINSKFSDCKNAGPGTLAQNFGSIFIDNCEIYGNTSASLGAAIVNFMLIPGSTSIKNTKITNNTLTNAQVIRQTIGAFLNIIISNLDNMSSQASVNGGSGGNTFIGNISGIIDKLSSINNALTNLSIANDNRIGGTIATLLPSALIIDNCCIENNFIGKNVSMSNSPFIANGGAIFSLNSNIDIKNSIIKCNKSINDGGAIYNGNIMNINNTEIIENKSKEGNGGGIFNDTNAQAIILDTKINCNKARNFGGGIYNLGKLELISCKVEDNKAEHGKEIYSANKYIKIDTEL